MKVCSSYSSLLILPALASCASTGVPQVSALLNQRPSHSPSSMTLRDTPFVVQDKNYCGPATLSMAMQTAGGDLSPEQIAPEVFTESKKGSLQIDLLSAARRHGFMAVEIRDLENLLKEVSAGHPVIVLQNLALSWAPQWHYALVVGYDLESEEITLHTGSNAFKREKLRRFEHHWSLGEHWGLVILAAGELARSADEIAQLKAAAGLEKIGRSADAEKSYDAILKRWPQSLGALVGLGNISYQRKDYAKSVKFLEKAQTLHSNSQIVSHNLKIAKAAQRGI